MLTDDELKAIGRIAIRHALIGQVVEWSLWRLIDRDDDNIGVNLTKGWRLAVLADKLQALVPLRIEPGDFRNTMMEWIQKAKWANTQRNSIVHAALTRFPNDERLTHIRIVPGEEEAMLQFQSFNAEALHYLADALDKIAEEGAGIIGVLEDGDVLDKSS